MTTVNFLGMFPIWFTLLVALASGVACWKLYGLERSKVGQPYRFLLPLLRSLAITLVILILSGPTLHRRIVQGEPAKIVFLVDGSQSMTLTDPALTDDAKNQIAEALQWRTSIGPEASRVELSSRYERAIELLRGGPLLADLSKQFDVTVGQFSDSAPTILLQSTVLHPISPTDQLEAWDRPLGAATAIGEALSSTVQANSVGRVRDTSSVEGSNAQAEAMSSVLPASESARSLIVLLSDGRNNAGPSTKALIPQLEKSHSAVIAIGYGSEIEADDLAVVEVEYPKQLFYRDVLRGNVFIKERTKVGQSYQVSVFHNDTQLWRLQVESQNADRRRIEFSLPIDKVVEAVTDSQASDVKLSMVPLPLEVRLSELPSEADSVNNRHGFRLAATTHTSRMLVLDGRSRWETRYIKNLFERDSNWRVNAVPIGSNAAESPGAMPRGTQLQQFPRDKFDLLDYDLIVLGEVEAGVLNDEELGWIAEFVELSGGGLILIDGDFGYLHQDHFRPISPLLSLQHDPLNSTPILDRVRPASTTTQAAFLQIADDPADSVRTWSELQPLRVLRQMQALPGSEVLLETAENLHLPVAAMRQFGAGRVVHFASDETWRWRFRVADQVHGRFWNQLAAAVMRLPFSAENSSVSIDSGKLEYSPTDTVDIRCRLRQPDGTSAAPARVEAVVTCKDAHVIAIMTPHASLPGMYTASTGPFPSGEYRVTIRATEFSTDSLNLSTQFHVVAPVSIELIDTTCDANSLKELAERTGGVYLPESDVGRLSQVIKPFQAGQVIDSDIVLWQSYWWFTPIILLLIAEWILRKRSGLV